MKNETNTLQPHAGGLQANGNYTLHVWDSIGDCPPSQAYININYNSCCEVNDPLQYVFIEQHFEVIEGDNHPLSQYYRPKQTITIISNQTWYFDKPLVVPRGYTVEFANCDIMMKSCTKILVENGAMLTVQNSEIGYCGWKGIEAGGWYDCCQTQAFNCNLSYGCYSSSEVYVTHSKIHYADIAVMAGYKEDHTITECANTIINQEQSGGAKVELKNSIFSRNYIDVLFREYDNEQMHFDIETCGDKNEYSELNLSQVTNCIFTLPSAQQYCNSIKQNLFDRITSVGGSCHIVDLADSSSFFDPLFYVNGIGGMGQNLRGYLSHYSSVNFLTIGRFYLPAGIKNNTYSLPCSNLKLYK